MVELEELRTILTNLDAPSERKKVRDDADIHWLGRNLAMSNPPSTELSRARVLLGSLGARLVL